MIGFEIENYSVMVGRTTAMWFTRISLEGSSLLGAHRRATLYFRSSDATLSGTVELPDVIGEGDVHVMAFLPYDDFDRINHLLQTQASVSLVVTYETDPVQGTHSLSQVAVGTGVEIPGGNDESAPQ